MRFGKPSLNDRVFQSCSNFAVQSLNNLRGRILRRANSIPRARLVSGTVSATVAKFGSVLDLAEVVTAKARKAPEPMSGSEAGMASNMTCTCPAIRSVSAGAEPRYGT
jgi:hypothetical protein